MDDLLNLCAHDLMETAPKIFQAIRVEMQRGRSAEISVHQFRTMGYIQRNPDASVSDLAHFLMLTLPSISKLVDGLVKQGLVSREESSADRRRVTLRLTAQGESIVNEARAAAQARLAQLISQLSPEELETVHRAMGILHPIFVHPNPV